MDKSTEKIFNLLFEILEKRKQADSKNSYVASLYSEGNKKINSKIMEEAKEVCEAALEKDKNHLTHEAVDLLFHTFVLCVHNGVSLEDIEKELSRRYRTSGIEEKNSREKMKKAKNQHFSNNFKH